VGPEISVELKEFYGHCPDCGHAVLSDAAEQCSAWWAASFHLSGSISPEAMRSRHNKRSEPSSIELEDR